MKNLAVLCTALSIIPAASAAKNDLLIQTRLDQKSMNWVIDKTRLVLSNVDIKDGLTATIPLIDDSLIPLADIGDSEQFRQIKKRVTDVFHVSFKNAALRVRIPQIYYHVASLHAKPHSFSVKDPVFHLDTTASIQGFDLNLLNGIQVDLMLVNPTSKKLESYLTASVKPVGVSVPTSLPPANFDLSFETVRDQGFTFKLKDYNLNRLPDYIESHSRDLIIKMNQSGAPISADDIAVNPVIVKLSGLTRSIDFDSFKPLVQKKMPLILGKVFRGVGNALKNKIGPQILTQVFSQHTRSDFDIKGKHIYSHFAADAFAQPASNQLTIGVDGTLCTNELFLLHDRACVTHMNPFSEVRSITASDRKQGNLEVTATLAQGKADIALSVSEEYINRVLQTSVDAKLWDEMLAADHLKLGPKRVFVVFNHASNTPDLYLDLIYSGSGRGIERLFINERHPIRFPLRMSTSVHFQVRDKIPFLVIKTEKLMSDSNEIINGLPEYGLDSDLVWGLRRKIASMIVEMAYSLENKTAVEIELPLFKEVGLETSWSETSAFGQLNLYFKI